MWDVGLYPLTQCWYSEESVVHMVDKMTQYGLLLFRCGDGIYLSGLGSCCWTTSMPPTCLDCIVWFNNFLLQPQLQFPNGHDKYGRWVYLPEKDWTIQVPKWFDLLNVSSSTSLSKRKE